MKIKLKLSLVLLLTSALCSYGQNYLKVVDQSIKSNANTQGHTPNWPQEDSDGNRNPKQALIIVKYDGFPAEEVENLLITPDLTNLNRREELKDADGQPLTFLYVPLDNNHLSFSSKYGTERVNLNNLTNKGIYDMTLLVDKKMNVDIEPLTDYESVTVYLDRGEGKSTPARFNNVSLGRHDLVFQLPHGNGTVTREIIVTVNTERFNETTNPDLDIRQRMPVKIESTMGNVTVYVDDVEVSKQAPYTAYLPSGDHTFKVVNNNNEREFDVSTIKLEKGSTDVSIKLHPRERRKFEITASYDGMSNVPMMLYVNKEEAYKISEEHAKGERRSFTFDLPIGSTYKFRATYQGNEGKKTIKVNADMPYYEIIEIKKRRKFVWPWEREYIAPPVGLYAAYIQKQYQIKSGGENIYKGTLTFWDQEEGDTKHWLHGLKVGAQYQPTFSFGLGMFTGLFYEYYISKTDQFDLPYHDGLTSNFSKYQEHNLTLPIEVLYNFPFADKVALALHGGLEGNFTLARSYSGLVEEYDGIKYEDSYNALKDEDGFFPELPGVFTLYWQVGAQLRLGPVMLGAQLTRPVTKHNWEYNGVAYTTTSIKNSFSLTYVF